MKEGKYTKDETEQLRELYENGYKVEDIAKILDRKKKSVLNKVYHLALRRKI
jgi:hypothetical protein